MNMDETTIHNELTRLEKEISSDILKLRRYSARAEFSEELQNSINQNFEKATLLYKKLAKLEKSQPNNEELKKKKKKHKDELNNLKAHIKSMQQKEGNHPQQHSSSAPSNKTKTAEVVEKKITRKTLDPEENEKLEQELFSQVFDTYKEALDVVKAINAQAVETESVALESAELLKKQSEQLSRIDQELDELASHTKRGKKELTSLMRKLAKDRIIIILLILLALLIVVAVIAAIAILPFRGLILEEIRKRIQGDK